MYLNDFKNILLKNNPNKWCKGVGVAPNSVVGPVCNCFWNKWLLFFGILF
jgi:hypothetical protein